MFAPFWPPELSAETPGITLNRSAVLFGAALAIAVGGVASLGAYAWAQDGGPSPRVVAKR